VVRRLSSVGKHSDYQPLSPRCFGASGELPPDPLSTVGTRALASLGQYPSERNHYHRVGSHSPITNRTSYHPIAGSHYDPGGFQAAPISGAASFTYQQGISPHESRLLREPEVRKYIDERLGILPQEIKRRGRRVRGR